MEMVLYQSPQIHKDKSRDCGDASNLDLVERTNQEVAKVYLKPPVGRLLWTKPGVDSLNFDDLYNNLRVFKNDVKGSTASSSSTQNVAFVSENTSSTNDLDEYDLEEMDLKWQVAMISMRMKKFYKKTDAKEMWEAIKSRFGGNEESKKNKANDNSKRLGKKEESNALMTLDGGCVDWTSHSEDEQDNYAFMACNSSGSDTEREQLSDASIEIKAYTQGLKKVEAQLVAHQQGQLWLGYGDHRYDGILSYENDVLQSVFMNKKSELEKQPLYDRFFTAGGMHVSQPNESETQTSDFDTCESDCSVETHESLSEPTLNEPKVVNQLKVRSDAPIIEEYESDSEDEHDYPHRALKNKGIVDSGCSRHMTGNKAYLAEFQDFNGGPVAFGGSKGYITGKGKIKTGKLDFEDVLLCERTSAFQSLSVSQMWKEFACLIAKAQLMNLTIGIGDESEKVKRGITVFLDELERIKRQEMKANKEVEALRKEYAQETENLVIQAGAAKASSTNIFSTVSYKIQLKASNDSEIPPLEDIYQNSTDGIFTNSSYDDEGAVADFTNLEIIVNVSLIPTSRIISSHPSALILGDPTSAVQTEAKTVSKVVKALYGLHQPPKACLCLFKYHGHSKVHPSLIAVKRKFSDKLEQKLDRNQNHEVVNFPGRDSFLAIAKEATIMATSTTEAEYVAA
ncbi:hypothetical protein Tco_0057673 [Tanacetum coccineum]